MLNTMRAVVKEGRIELLEEIDLPEGTQALVTLLSDNEDHKFWLGASEPSVNAVWNNAEDDVYAELLKE